MKKDELEGKSTLPEEVKKSETIAEAIVEVGKFWVETNGTTKRFEIESKSKNEAERIKLDKQRLWLFSTFLLLVLATTIVFTILGLFNTAIASVITAIGTISIAGIGITFGSKKD